MSAKTENVQLLPIKALKPYERNARTHSEDQLDKLVNSIREFGFINPVIIDESDTILVGHGRTEAARRAGMSKVPCIRVEGLTDDQKRAYILADNKLSDLGGWDYDILKTEIDDIELDMSLFGFDTVEPIPLHDDDDGYYGDARERTNRAYHLDILDPDNLTNDFWQMPVLRAESYIPKDLIGFNYAKSSKDKEVGIHFYVDDYQFERIWNYPEKYLDTLLEYDCILTPDFSLYLDMPMPMKIWNVYRSRQIGAYYQSKGLTVIPTVQWAEPETFAFCFQGIEPGGVVSISTIGVKRDKHALEIWREGVTEMIAQTEPSTILVYGGELEYDYGGIQVIYYDNKVTERMSQGGQQRREK